MGTGLPFFKYGFGRDHAGVTPASPACPVAQDQTLSPLARARALGGLLFAHSVRYACQGLWRPWTLRLFANGGVSSGLMFLYFLGVFAT